MTAPRYKGCNRSRRKASAASSSLSYGNWKSPSLFSGLLSRYPGSFAIRHTNRTVRTSSFLSFFLSSSPSRFHQAGDPVDLSRAVIPTAAGRIVGRSQPTLFSCKVEARITAIFRAFGHQDQSQDETSRFQSQEEANRQASLQFEVRSILVPRGFDSVPRDIPASHYTTKRLGRFYICNNKLHELHELHELHHTCTCSPRHLPIDTCQSSDLQRCWNLE